EGSRGRSQTAVPDRSRRHLLAGSPLPFQHCSLPAFHAAQNKLLFLTEGRVFERPIDGLQKGLVFTPLKELAHGSCKELAPRDMELSSQGIRSLKERLTEGDRGLDVRHTKSMTLLPLSTQPPARPSETPPVRSPRPASWPENRPPSARAPSSPSPSRRTTSCGASCGAGRRRGGSWR